MRTELPSTPRQLTPVSSNFKMTYKARSVDSEVNLPKRHPLADMLWLIGGLAAVTLILYVVSGWLVDKLVDRIPSSADNAISMEVKDQIAKSLGGEITDGELFDATNTLFNELRAQLPADDERDYKLIIVDNPVINAAAAPGGIIIVFKGLLDETESENELAMVLAHEFGHTYHKHHWKRMGRGILFGLSLAFIAGNMEVFQANLSAAPLTALQRGYDRSKESESDRFAIELVCQRYGHTGGADDFFARHIGEDAGSSRFATFFTTHPLSEQRVEAIAKWSRELDCSDGALAPFP